MVKQGDIVTVNFNPSLGHEQRGYRPALVISSSIVARYSGLFIVAPISSTSRSYPAYVKLETANSTTGQVLLDQTIALDLHARQSEVVDSIERSELQSIINRYKLLFDLDE